MRKLYVLSDEEFDEEFESEKYDLCDGQIENPTCPRCGRELLLAYVAGGELEVVTWDYLSNEDKEGVEAWYLVCGDFTCAYEDEVELVSKPAGAVLYDLADANWGFSCETGFHELNPVGTLQLAEQLRQLQAEHPNRKLPSLIEDLQWQYDERLKDLRKWLSEVPDGRQISFHHLGEQYEGYLVTHTEDHMVVRPADGGEAVAYPLNEISFFGPRYFRDETEEPKDPEFGKGSRFIMIHSRDRCVVQGYHLHLDEVDRFGRYHCRTWDEATGKALGMKHLGGTCYEGIFRRDDIEGRYDLRRIVKVQGIWLEWFGPTEKEDVMAVRTEDPEVAKALGLKPWHPWFPNEDGTWPPPPYWYGFMRQEEVEAQEEHPVWMWPFPEAKGCDR